MRSNYRRESIPFLDQREPRWRNCEELEMNSEEQGKNDRTLMRIYCMEWQGLTGADEMRRLPPFLWTGQGDAAAEVDEDQESGGGGGARALERQRRKTMEGKSDEDLWAGPIYKDD